MMAKKKLPERHVEMADGTILDAEIGQAGPDLWIMYNDGTDYVTAAKQAGNPAKTARMIFRYPGYEQTWEGYTDLIMLKTGVDGHIQARLRKEDAGDV